VVTELVVAADGTVESSEVFEAAVHNRAKLDYVGVAEWATGGGPVPPPLRDDPAMQGQVRLQLEVGRMLGEAAERGGALAFETDRLLAVVRDGHVVGLVAEEKNVANEAVAHMMIATNKANAAFLRAKGFPVLQRAMPA